MKWAAFVLLASLTSAQAVNPDKRLEYATAALRSFLSPESTAPKEIGGKAQCVVVLPHLIKGTSLIGMKYGHGFASCRKGTGGWSSPAAIVVEGSQLGSSDKDVLTFVMKPISDDFTFDAEATSYASGKQAWSATSLDGAMLKPDPSENKKIYGRELTNADILSGKVVPPRGAKALVALLTKRARKTR